MENWRRFKSAITKIYIRTASQSIVTTIQIEPIRCGAAIADQAQFVTFRIVRANGIKIPENVGATVEHGISSNGNRIVHQVMAEHVVLAEVVALCSDGFHSDEIGNDFAALATIRNVVTSRTFNGDFHNGLALFATALEDAAAIRTTGPEKKEKSCADNHF